MALNFPSSPTVGQTHNATNGLSYYYDGVKWTVQGTYASSAGAQQYKIDNISSDFNGSTTTFNLRHNSSTISVSSALDVTISIGGVLQEPETAYTVNPTASTITFTEAPPSGASFFGILKSKLADQNVTPSDGTVTSSKIVDGAIVNVDVNASAAIDATKLEFTQAGTSAQPRTIDSKLKEILSVTDFIPPGTNTATTNCAGYIQLAVNKLNSLAPTTPATLYFPAGTYKITAPINFSLNSATDRPMREIVGGDGTGYAARIDIQYHGYGSSLVSGNDKGAFYFGPESDGASNNQAPFSISGFEFKGDSATYKHAPAIECKGPAQSFISNIKISSINNAAISFDSPQNIRITNVISYFCGRSFKYKDRGSFTVTHQSTNDTLTANTTGLFDNNDIGKNIAMWGANSHRRKTKIKAVAVDGQTATVEDAASSTITDAQNIIFGSPFIHNGGTASSTTITSDAATFSADDVGAYVWFKITGHDGIDCLLRRKITNYTSTTQVTIDSNLDVAISPSTAESGVIRCEIAVPAIELFSNHGSGNSSDNKFTNLQVEGHYGVGVCAENQSVLDFINTKIHAEQGTNDDIDAVDKYSLACMWLMQVDGSYLGKFEGQYIGRNKLWITGQTSTFTLVNLLVGSSDFERIIGIEKKNTSYDGAALVISGLQVNHAWPTHTISNLIEDTNLSASGIPTGYLMNGPFINQGSSANRVIEGYVTQNVFVQEAGTTSNLPKMYLNATNKNYSITPGGGSGYNQLQITNETDSEKLIFSLAAGNWVFISNKDGSVTPGTPSGGGYLYVDAGALKYKGSSGTVTTLGNA